MAKGLLDGLGPPQKITLPKEMLGPGQQPRQPDASGDGPNPAMPVFKPRNTAPEPKEEAPKKEVPPEEPVTPEVTEEEEEETVVPEVTPESIQTQDITDPWTPFKERFKERDPNEVLSEWETIQSEREELKVRLQQKEDRERELTEKLVAYDVQNDPEYIANVVGSQREADEVLLNIFALDRETADKALNLYYNKDMDQKQRAAELKDLLNENVVSQADFFKAVKDREKAYSRAKEYHENWRVHQQKRQEEAVRQAEQRQKENEDRLRWVNRTAVNKTEAKLKELNLDMVLDGFEDSKKEHLTNVERILDGSGTNMEEDVMYNIIGRMFMKSHKGLKEKLAKLADLDSAGRAKPDPTTPKKTAPSKPVNNPLVGMLR